MYERPDMPEVSVIMNCLNCEKYLSEAIDSVYAQNYQDWEIIFWDNASTDNSADIAKSYDNRLRYFRGEQTIPLGYARNMALEKATGTYVAFLDCDDLWLPEKLEKQIELFKKNPEVALVYSNCYVIDMSGNIMKTSFDTSEPARGQAFNELFLRNNFIPLLTVVIRKTVLDKVGKFEPLYKISEEYDIFLKITHSHLIDYVDSPLAKYRVHSANFSINLNIGIKEELEILDKWLSKDPSLARQFGNKIRLKKLKRMAVLCNFYLVKYLHLPKKLAKFY
jgi:glycosyltransferase involved in cell wall biosynthesis